MIRTNKLLLSLLAVAAVSQLAAASASFNNGCNGNKGKWGWGWHWAWGNDCDDDFNDWCNKHKGKDHDHGCYNNGGKGGKGGNCGGGKNCDDTTPPEIVCPPLAKFFCGDSTSPDNTGYPEVTDDTDANPKVTYTDKVQSDFCGASRFDRIITRTWKAKDDCGNVSTCTQSIDVVKRIAELDVLPGVCPNNFVYNCNSLPVTLVGTDTFNVGNVVLSSVRMYAEDCAGGVVAPKNVCYGDVTAPAFASELCGCAELGPDGKNDLTLYFSKSKLLCAFDLDQLPSGSTFRVVISGKLCTGCEFIATDCLLIP